MQNNFLGKKTCNGQTLVEILIAIGIVAIGALALSRTVTTSVKSSRFSEEQNFANSLAQQKIADEINTKNQDPDAYFNPLTTSDNFSYSLQDLYCVQKNVKDVSVAEGLSVKTMALVSFDVYWNWKGSSTTSCSSTVLSSYEHSIHQQTYVTR